MASTGPHPTSARAAPPSPHSSSSSTNSNADLIILSSSDDDDRAAGTRKMRRAPIYQKWRFSDEVDLLTWLAAERRRCGELPSWSELFKALTKKERDAPALKRANLTAPDLKKKVSNLKEKFIKAVGSGGPGDIPRDQILYGLSREVWPDAGPRVVHFD
ncbi:hypothetical protein PAHAL_7G002600 [Panicum hallii]|jgi:hypothetical protein|uniref:Glabrous enhancer-binding protein-like DBD domain-containing protein n=1 Tax=Panicum hallii TaxID=206008 RepID=A0A2T8IAF0_9POAL|nr:hypothetical protein PAHAL_7G002600 [Panicum hallii]